MKTAIINNKPHIWSNSRGWIRPDCEALAVITQPVKQMKHVTLTDTDTGESITVQVETEQSLRARLSSGRCNHCGLELDSFETDNKQATCDDCLGLVARDKAEAEYWRDRC